MKISNFKFEKMDGITPLDKVFWASVDVETGLLFWKKKERRRIRRKYADGWCFVDNGEYVPSYQIESLARAYEAQTGQKT